jgi:nucleoside-diphosphate-sugar epimerase
MMDDSRNSRVLVTGSSGFIGTNLMDLLMKEGYEVRGIDIRPPQKPSHQACFIHCNVEDRDTLHDVFSSFRPEQVVHLAARTDLGGQRLEEYRANHEGTRNVMDASSSVAGVERVLFASSRLVNRIGDKPKDWREYSPSTSYGESKVAGEEILREAGKLNFDWCIVRPTSIWGPWFGVPYRDFFDAVLSRRYVHPASAKIVKSFGYVGNTVYQILGLLRANADLIDGQTFYLMDYDPIEVRAFAREISNAAGSKDIFEVPFWMLRGLAAVGDLAGKLGYPNPPLTTFRLSNLITDMIYDASNLALITGPLPYDAAEGVSETIRWMRECT